MSYGYKFDETGAAKVAGVVTAATDALHNMAKSGLERQADNARRSEFHASVKAHQEHELNLQGRTFDGISRLMKESHDQDMAKAQQTHEHGMASLEHGVQQLKKIPAAAGGKVQFSKQGGDFSANYTQAEKPARGTRGKSAGSPAAPAGESPAAGSPRRGGRAQTAIGQGTRAVSAGKNEQIYDAEIVEDKPTRSVGAAPQRKAIGSPAKALEGGKVGVAGKQEGKRPKSGKPTFSAGTEGVAKAGSKADTKPKKQPAVPKNAKGAIEMGSSATKGRLKGRMLNRPYGG